MCSPSDHSVFSASQICGFGVGGFCNIALSKCECNEGFTHDLLTLRQRDCSVPLVSLKVVFGLIMAMSALTFFYSLSKVKDSISTAKTIMLMVCGCQFFLFLYAVCHFANGFRMNWATVLTCYFSLSLFLSHTYAVFYSLASPLYKIAEKSEDGFLFAIKTLWVVFRAIQLCITITAIAVFQDFTLEKNDFGWSVCLSLSIGFYGVEACIATGVIIYFGRRLIKFVELLIEMTPNNLNHATTKHYLKKVKVLVTVISIVCPGASIIAALIPIMYLSLGYLPFSYIPVSVIWSAIPPLSVFVVSYSAREKVSTQVQVLSPSKIDVPNNVASNIQNNGNGSTVNGSNMILSNEHDMQSNYLTSLYEESKVQSSNSEVP